mgnify:CR=1 FL=1
MPLTPLLMIYRGQQHWMIKFLHSPLHDELGAAFLETDWPLTWERFRVELQVRHDFPNYRYAIGDK